MSATQKPYDTDDEGNMEPSQAKLIDRLYPNTPHEEVIDQGGKMVERDDMRVKIIA